MWVGSSLVCNVRAEEKGAAGGGVSGGCTCWCICSARPRLYEECSSSWRFKNPSPIVTKVRDIKGHGCSKKDLFCLIDTSSFPPPPQNHTHTHVLWRCCRPATDSVTQLYASPNTGKAPTPSFDHSLPVVSGGGPCPCP